MNALPLDSSRLYADHRLIRDLIDGTGPLVEAIGEPFRDVSSVAETRRAALYPRDAVCDLLREYNRRLGAPAAVLDSIETLRRPDALCTLTGQQAGFLGGPAYTMYKIVSALRLAEHASRSGRPVVPVFWLASEYHDFTEINRARLLAPDGRVETYRFDWAGRGRAIETMPITAEIAEAAEAALERLAPGHRKLFAPAPGDDYATWHARIWTHLFGNRGLIVVEPRILRPLCGDVFSRAMRLSPRLKARLAESAQRFREAGYDVSLDPDRAGVPFRLTEGGERIRVDAPEADAAEAERSPERFSADAALRPLAADSLLPTLAHVLGPGELAYHALLASWYAELRIPRPLLVPRHGYTIVSQEDAAMLQALGIPMTDAAIAGFDPSAALEQRVEPALREAFADARARVRREMEGLREPVAALDPGLEARWRQASGRADQEIERLYDKAARADLARQGLSNAQVRRLAESLRPGGKLQERALSSIHFVARFGVEWLQTLPWTSDGGPFAHYLVTLEGAT